jgi:hypothetical protein
MATRVAVVIPSRLSPDPDGIPYMQAALASIRAQRCPGIDVCIIVALDPGLSLHVAGSDVQVLKAPEANQASAVNTGMDAGASSADFIAHLEDDDLWRPHHLQSALDAIAHYDADFVSSSSELFSDLPPGAPPPAGHVATSGIFDFPIASTWVMRPAVWRAAGGYDPSYRVHPDNDWLGRLNALNRFRRIHLLEPGLRTPGRPWVANVCQVSWVVPCPEGLSVRRRVLANSVLGQKPAGASSAEYQRILGKYGYIPW